MNKTSLSQKKSETVYFRFLFLFCHSGSGTDSVKSLACVSGLLVYPSAYVSGCKYMQSHALVLILHTFVLSLLIKFRRQNKRSS